MTEYDLEMPEARRVEAANSREGSRENDILGLMESQKTRMVEREYKKHPLHDRD